MLSVAKSSLGYQGMATLRIGIFVEITNHAETVSISEARKPRARASYFIYRYDAN